MAGRGVNRWQIGWEHIWTRWACRTAYGNARWNRLQGRTRGAGIFRMIFEGDCDEPRKLFLWGVLEYEWDDFCGASHCAWVGTGKDYYFLRVDLSGFGGLGGGWLLFSSGRLQIRFLITCETIILNFPSNNLFLTMKPGVKSVQDQQPPSKQVQSSAASWGFGLPSRCNQRRPSCNSLQTSRHRSLCSQSWNSRGCLWWIYLGRAGIFSPCSARPPFAFTWACWDSTAQQQSLETAYPTLGID